MAQAYLPTQGDPVSPDNLTSPKAQELVRLLKSKINPFAWLVECQARPDEEIVVLEVDVEVPQYPAYDIRHRERIAVAFSVNDQRQPEVLALRRDFPLVPHINLGVTELPRSLCLYDRPYHEIKIHWTAATFLERIRDWLAQTAKRQLYGEDQPLEPLLLNSVEDLVLPEDLLTTELSGAPEWLAVRLVTRSSNLFTAIASRSETGRVEGNRPLWRWSCPAGLRCMALYVIYPARSQTSMSLLLLPASICWTHCDRR